MGSTRSRPLLAAGFACAALAPVVAAQGERGAPVAEIFGHTVYANELTVPGAAGTAPRQAADEADAASRDRATAEALRARVWRAVFDDYARARNITPTEADIASHLDGHRRMQKRMDAERVQQRTALAAELKRPDLSARRRQEAQQHLETLDRLAAFEAQHAAEQRDPARRKIQQDAERRVAEQWVRQWKLNQTLYREFGGRIIFQQAGWEPIDAYRKLLEQYEARRAFVVHDPALRAAVYSYFQHNFVYADEAKATFYFEKPYWERTPEEMRAAGF